ncbi:MAG TPA: cupin domain-containing protein [Patescibacteria group bacterium]|nr:cupin domain-containing protein [Patescibacteria group bacterium]
MEGFIGNIEKETLDNSDFRRVLFTGQHAQVVLMSLKPKEDIGMEVHEIVDQFIRIEKGNGKVIMNGEEHVISDGSAFVVPAGTEHNVINESEDSEMNLYTVYSPPHHRDGTIHKTKEDAEKDSGDHL